MASEFYGLNRGETEFKLHEGAATQSTDIEVRIDTGKGWTMAEIMQKLNELENAILKNASKALTP